MHKGTVESDLMFITDPLYRLSRNAVGDNPDQRRNARLKCAGSEYPIDFAILATGNWVFWSMSFAWSYLA